MSGPRTVALVPGDGVGEEVLAGPIEIARALEARGVLRLTGPWPAGATSFGATGEVLPAASVAACEAADAVLLGAIGEHPGVAAPGFRPELALIGLREHFDLRVSVRQVWQPKRAPLTFVRNLLGGAYGAASVRVESDGSGPASDTFTLTVPQVRELVGIAAGYVAREGGPLVSVDKANLLATSRLWRAVVSEAAADLGVEVRHVLVDRFAFELGGGDLPEGVVLTEGLFGDILSDLACGRAGSIALCGSASVNPGTPSAGSCVGLFEPVHGSAPRRAGHGVVNPAGGFLALAALLEWFADTAAWAAPVRDALGAALVSGPPTYDLAGGDEATATTAEFSARVVAAFADSL
jgi:isocitrate/isopropylmalate dehydrogenase